LIWGYCHFFSFFKYIEEVAVFSQDHLSDVFLFLVLFILDNKFCADVDSFQLNFVVDFIPS